jgi:hypothetical protein
MRRTGKNQSISHSLCCVLVFEQSDLQGRKNRTRRHTTTTEGWGEGYDDNIPSISFHSFRFLVSPTETVSSCEGQKEGVSAANFFNDLAGK